MEDQEKKSGNQAENLNETMEVRTDLALEEKERFQGDGGEIKGVSLREWQDQKNQLKVTEVKILDDQGAKAMGF